MLARLDPGSAAARRGLSDLAIRNLFIIPTIVFLIVFNIFPLIYSLGLFVHRFPRLGERAGQLRRAAELPRTARRRVHLEQLHDHGEVRAGVGRRAGAGRLRRGAAAQSQHAGQRAGHHAAAAADDDVDGGGRPVLAAALQPVLGHHQLRAAASEDFEWLSESRRRAVRRRAHRHLDVVAVRDAAVARRPVGDPQAPVRGRGDRSRQPLVHLHAHHAAAGHAAAADRHHLPHHGGVQDLRPRLHHDQHGDDRADRHPAVQDGVPGMADRATPARSPTSC